MGKDANARKAQNGNARFFVKLNYQTIAECLEAGLIHDNPDLAHKERYDTIMEATKAIPAIHEANIGGLQAEIELKPDVSALRSHSSILTAMCIAQDMGYEW